MKVSIVLCGYGDETRAALFEAPGEPGAAPRSYRRLAQRQWRPAELGIDRASARSLVGSLYRGRVVNVVPALEAAFVDVGLEKNGFLHQRELLGNRPIHRQLRVGDEILVQVIRDAVKTKGPRLSQQVSLVGRSLVWMPYGSGVGTSRKLSDKQRTKYRKLLTGATEGGLIVRTAGSTQDLAGFQAEIAYLHRLWEIINRREEVGTCVYYEPSIGIRWLREIRVGELDSVFCDHPETAEEIREFLRRTDPKQAARVRLVESGVWEETGAQSAWDSVFEPYVALPSGGSLVIDQAEAMTVIDVNSGSFVRGRRLKDTILTTNLEAADEIAAQLRLRDVGGLVVADFIDMDAATDRQQVETAFNAALERDRARWTASRISELGLVEMSRQNLAASVRDLVSEPCPCCAGSGTRIGPATAARELWRSLRLDPPSGECIHVTAPTEVIEWLTHNRGERLTAVEAECGRKIVLSDGPMGVVSSGPYDQMLAEAAPVAVGDEIWVRISEPHMYDPNAAVAKLGNYPVSVADAIGFVGKGAMLRITELLPTHARATIIDHPSVDLAEELQPSARRERRKTSRNPA